MFGTERGGLGQCGMRLAAAASLAVVALAPAAVRAQAEDLATVLSKQANVSTYIGLLNKYPDVFGKLPASGATVIVPTDAAFVKFQAWDRGDADYAASLLQYHILQGQVSIGSIAVGDSLLAPTTLTNPRYSNVTGGAVVKITKQPGNVVVLTSGMATRATLVGSAADIPFSGGLVHLVDSILAQPARLEPTAREAYRDLSSFLGALYAAEVLPRFADTPNVTIFAPRNAAMQQVAGALQVMSRQQLSRVLQYHLVPGRVLHSAELRNESDFSSALHGQAAADPQPPPLHITLNNNDIFVGSARVIQTDILVANGVVHILEDVLNPDAGPLRPDVSVETQSAAFTLTGPVSTGTSAPLPFTTALPCTLSCATSTAPGRPQTGSNTVRTSSSSGVAPGGLTARATEINKLGLGFSIAMGIAGVDAIRGIYL